MARFLADLILAKVQLPNVFYMDNSKAEEYALLAFFCQWICANKRRLNCSTRCVVMAQDSTSLRGVNTAFPREKLHWRAREGLQFVS